jgi:altered-inheritance-of-mitochondria protein 13
VNQLNDQLVAPAVTPERQATLDGHIRAQIATEVMKLREQEEHVLHQIAVALEKENIDREKALQGADSSRLRQDLEDTQRRLDAFNGRSRVPKQFPEVESARAALVACYRSDSNHDPYRVSHAPWVISFRANGDTELDCYQEVERFKAAVTKVEQVRRSQQTNAPPHAQPVRQGFLQSFKST